MIISHDKEIYRLSITTEPRSFRADKDFVREPSGEQFSGSSSGYYSATWDRQGFTQSSQEINLIFGQSFIGKLNFGRKEFYWEIIYYNLIHGIGNDFLQSIKENDQ